MLISVFVVGILLVGCGNNSSDSSAEDADNSAKNESNENNATDEEVGNDNDGNENETGEETIALRFGHVLSEESDYHKIATTMAEEVEKRSNGSMVIDVFGQGQLGDEAQLVASARSGDTALLLTAFAPISNIVEEFSIFDLPYLFDSFEHANEVLASDLGQSYFDLLPEHGIIALGHAGAAEFNVYAKEPVQEVADMKGLKVRIPPSQGYLLSFEELGAQPTPTEYSEIYVGLQQGTIDGGVTSPEQYIQDKFVEVAQNYSLTKSHQQQRVLIMSKEIMDSLTPEQQEIIWESADVALQAGKDYYKQLYNDSLEEAQKLGAEVIEPDFDGFKEAIQGVYEKALQDIPNGQELFNELQEVASK